MTPADSCRSTAAACYATFYNPWAPVATRLQAYHAAPMFERMALALDASDPLTARGDDLRRLAVLYGVPEDGEEEDARARLLARLSGAWEKTTMAAGSDYATRLPGGPFGNAPHGMTPTDPFGTGTASGSS